MASTLTDTRPECTEAEYLDITERGFEYVDGRLEELPVPTALHQDLIYLFCSMIVAHSSRRHMKFAGYRLHTVDGRYREPDVMYVADLSAWQQKAAVAADLAIEVVSDGASNRRRDHDVKRDEYERAGIAEYWIVDPQEKTVTRLSLKDGTYAEETSADGVLTSAVLPGFAINAATVWAEASGE